MTDKSSRWKRNQNRNVYVNVTLVEQKAVLVVRRTI